MVPPPLPCLSTTGHWPAGRDLASMPARLALDSTMLCPYVLCVRPAGTAMPCVRHAATTWQGPPLVCGAFVLLLVWCTLSTLRNERRRGFAHQGLARR
eukprot:1257183-Prymnesium_polylepis.1